MESFLKIKILAGVPQVPQGSVLGPLLFLIFIDNIVHSDQHAKIRLFADEACLFIEVDDRTITGELLNIDLETIGQWSNKWLVKFAPKKTKSLIVSNKVDAHLNSQVQLFGQFIVEVESHMY